MSDHLVVLVHGLWGNPEHMWYVKKALAERHENVQILVSDTNVGNRTYDGIDVCGERIAKEVRDRITTCRDDKDKQEIKKISFVGYSLGGLGARYAIGVLHSSNFFDTVQAMSYTTFATPHCGVSPTSTGFFAWLVSSIGPKTLSVTGSHIFLADGGLLSKKKRTLLENMSDPEGPFFKGLEKFERRTCYANIINDRSVPYFTAAISNIDPFTDLSRVKLYHDEKYGNAILDSKVPFEASPEPIAVAQPALSAREMLFRGVMVAGLPLWLTIYSANAVVANYASGRRIAEHRSSSSQDDGSASLSTVTQDVVEEIMDKGEEVTAEESVLTLNPAQKNIVRNMNTLDWRKFCVHIQKTQHSHAAIVCRTRDSERLTEGHHVMRHWLDNVFVV